MARYLSGLCVASLGLCAGGWLIAATVLLNGEPTDASLVSLGTGAGLAVVSAVGIACWSVAWRQRMRRDGVLADGPLPAARPVSAGGPVKARQARRSGRMLRRDMRRAAHAARHQARRCDAASQGTIAIVSAQRDNAGIETIPPRAVPTPGLSERVPSTHAPPPHAPPPEDPAALLLSEIRALLGPLLAAVPDGEESW